MGYSVQVGASGYLGWKVLERTAAMHQRNVANDPEVQRSIGYFVSELPHTEDVGGLVGNFRLLRVVLGAFGLEGDVNNKFFLQKILESDPGDKGSLVNRLSDKRYLQLNRAVGAFGNSAFSKENAENISDMYIRQEFERRVGEKDQKLRIALYAQRELIDLALKSGTENRKWYEVLGSKPLRTLFEGAFGFGASYAKIPLERQVFEFRNGLDKAIGSDKFSVLSDPKNVDVLIQRFLLRAEVRSDRASSFSTALRLLRF